MDGYKTLKAGQAVNFELLQGPKGLHAINIRPCSTSADAPAMIGEEQPSAADTSDI
jgi:CspA family cold shock protein